MTKKTAKLLATSPFVKPGEGSAHKRVVLKAEYYGTDHVEYIVHNEYVYENGVASFSDGSYFPTSRVADSPSQNIVHTLRLSEAWDCFNQRANNLMKRVLASDYVDQLSDLNSERFAKFNFDIRGKG